VLQALSDAFDGLAALGRVPLDLDPLEPDLGVVLEDNHVVAEAGALVVAPRRDRLPRRAPHRVGLVHGAQVLDDGLGDPAPRAEQALEPAEVPAVRRRSEREPRVDVRGGERDARPVDDRVVERRDGQEWDGRVADDVVGRGGAVVGDGGVLRERERRGQCGARARERRREGRTKPARGAVTRASNSKSEV